MTQEETLELLVKTLQEANKAQTEKNEYLKEISLFLTSSLLFAIR